MKLGIRKNADALQRLLFLVMASISLIALVIPWEIIFSQKTQVDNRTTIIGGSTSFADCTNWILESDIALISDFSSYPSERPSITLTMTNYTQIDCLYGSDNILEIWVEGEWYEVYPEFPQYGLFPDLHILRAQESIQWDEQLLFYGTKFVPGKYRIIKSVVTKEIPVFEENACIEENRELYSLDGYVCVEFDLVS